MIIAMKIHISTAAAVLILILGANREVSAWQTPGPHSNDIWDSYNGLP
jgi:hypothetical protein